jgi:hypothetical protein
MGKARNKAATIDWARPPVRQRAHEIQALGHRVPLPIALSEDATRQGVTTRPRKDRSGQIEAVPRTPSGGEPSITATAFLAEMVARLERLTRHLEECLAIPERRPLDVREGGSGRLLQGP